VTGALRTNRELLLPCAAPYLAYVVVATLAAGRLERELDYALRIAVAGGTLAWAWPRLLPLRGANGVAGSLGWGAAAGVLGLGLWIAALTPLVRPEAGVAWSDGAWLLRVCAAVLLVPLFEEQLLRGWVLGVATQWDRLRRAGEPEPFEQAFGGSSVLELEPHAWTPAAVALSSAAFALGHATAEWPAALLYGGLMAGLRIFRGDLLTCVAAHAVTNLGLALYVRATGSWALW
jgi:uncharacterized protein